MHTATKSSKLDISVEDDTAKIARNFSNFLKKGDVIFFYGETGVGKTTFIRHLINNLQKKNNVELTEVPSPTFNIVNEFKIKNLIIQHFDLFRLKNQSETTNIGLLEDSKEILTLVEWPEKIKKKPKKAISLYFEYIENFEKRSLIIDGFDTKKIK
jgi:tRNA threonylcarbamoyladenosine biosynthesis protein TsaE